MESAAEYILGAYALLFCCLLLLLVLMLYRCLEAQRRITERLVQLADRFRRAAEKRPEPRD